MTFNPLVGELALAGLYVGTRRAQFAGNNTPTTGTGVEVGSTGTTGIINSYDRSSSLYVPLAIYGNGISLYPKLTSGPGTTTVDVYGGLNLMGSTSGYTTLQAAATAGSQSFTLPSTDGVSGQFLQTNGSGVLSFGSGLTGFRNRLHNGDMRISQLYPLATNAVPIGTSVTRYACDRWGFQSDANASATATIEQNEGSAPLGFSDSLFYRTGATTWSSPVYSGSFIYQTIEGNDLADFRLGSAFASGSMTLSFYAYVSQTGTYGVIIDNGSPVGDLYGTTFTVTSAASWVRYTIVIPVPTSGTFAQGNSGALRIRFPIQGNGSTAGGSWGGGGTPVNTVSGTTLLGGVANAYMGITGVQLELGSVATEFERRPYAVEMDMVRRYHPVFSGKYAAGDTTSTAVTNTYFGTGYTTSSSAGISFVQFAVPTRTPVTGFTQTAYNVTVLSPGGSGSASCSFAASSLQGAQITWSSFVGGSTGTNQPCLLSSSQAVYFTGAEL